MFGVDHDNQLDMRLINTFQQELRNLLTNNNHPIIVIALYNNKTLPATLQRIFLETIIVKPPSESERQEMLKWIFQTNSLSINIEVIANLASQTAGFLFGDLKILVTKSIKNNTCRSESLDENAFNATLGEILSLLKSFVDFL